MLALMEALAWAKLLDRYTLASALPGTQLSFDSHRGLILLGQDAGGAPVRGWLER